MAEKKDIQLQKLKRKFTRFAKMHGFNKKDMELLNETFKTNMTTPFDDAFTWSDRKEGHDFFYFLSLRWLMFLIVASKQYDLLYTESFAIFKFRRICQYSTHCHAINVGDDKTIEYQINRYNMEKSFYEKFIQKF